MMLKTMLLQIPQQIRQLRTPRHLRPVYAKIPHSQRLLIAVLYTTLIIVVVFTLRSLGSNIRTRTLPVGSISIATDYAKYTVGDPVKFTVTNNYNAPIYITNTCPSEPLEVYKLDGGTAWKRIHDSIDTKDCPASDRQVKVPAHASTSGDYSRWKNLFNTPGTYRIVVYVDYYNSLPYTDFEVIEKPKIPELPALLPPKQSVVAASPNNSSSTSANTASTAQNQSNNSTPSTTTPAAPARQSKTINLSVGTVKVEYTSTSVYVLSVTPASGYTYEGGGSGQSVEITFKKPGQDETQLKLSVTNGQLTQRVETGD